MFITIEKHKFLGLYKEFLENLCSKKFFLVENKLQNSIFNIFFLIPNINLELFELLFDVCFVHIGQIL